MYGPERISINVINKEIGSPRASFYHHFSDLDIYIDALLEAHFELTQSFIQEGQRKCEKLIPDLYQLLSEFAPDLRFNRQLFINRHIPLYGFTFSKVFDQTASDFIIDLFIEEYNLRRKIEDVFTIWLMFAESWYIRIDP